MSISWVCGVTDIGIFIVAVINFISAVAPNHTEKKKNQQNSKENLAFNSLSRRYLTCFSKQDKYVLKCRRQLWDSYNKTFKRAALPLKSLQKKSK